MKPAEISTLDAAAVALDLNVNAQLAAEVREIAAAARQAGCCTCPSGDGSLRWPCPQHPPEDVARTAVPAQADEVDKLLTELMQATHRKGELWNQCQGKFWPEKEGADFTRLRDVVLPVLRNRIFAALTQRPARPVAGEPAKLLIDFTLEEESVKFLADMIAAGEKPASLRFQVGAGHSGFGLYVCEAEYPEEGSTLVQELPHLAAPTLPATEPAQAKAEAGRDMSL